MWIALVLSVFFLIGAVANLAVPKPNVAGGIVGLALSGLLCGAWFIFRHRRKRDEELLAWMVAHAAAIRSGGARYRDMTIGPRTELVRFQVALAFVVVHFKWSSRFLISGQEPCAGVVFFYSLVSLLFGWWGFPWGPVFTVQALAKNLRGGERMTAEALLATVSVPTGAA